MKRVIMIVLDSVGIGALPDANLFGDEGAHTIKHILEKYPDLKIDNLKKLGYGNIEGDHLIKPIVQPIGAYGRLKEISNGKDTTIGHWEMMGIYTKEAFPTYSEGFPEELLNQFLLKTGLKGYLGNKVASGTEILEELGEAQIKTGYPIIYTSADSVFQIAMEETITPIKKLYEYCEIARELCAGKYDVARVIARPYIYQDGKYIRTSNRRDYSKEPSHENLMVYLKESGINVHAIGKISDIFADVGISTKVHTTDNMDGVNQTLLKMKDRKDGFIFTNLVEFDSKWGHRRDVFGYAKGLEAFDERLPEIIDALSDDDLLIICADHGCDPTYKGTDHTREYIPFLCYGKWMKHGVSLGTGESFADIGQTIAAYFGIKPLFIGKNRLNEMKE